MRPIRFRGKPIEGGGFIYGGYANDEGCIFILTSTSVCVDASVDSWENRTIFKQVKPETVGQYTGLKDKNVKEVYDGDILSSGYVVRFGVVDIEDNEGYSDNRVCGFYVEHYVENHWKKDHIDLGYIGTVIGNIYDNPELMEGS